MDSSSRSASPREPSRPSHRPPSPPAAFENKGYQHDDADSNHNTDAMTNGKNHANDSFGANGETKTLEAVNLELVNLAPKNGNAKKKDVEVDMAVNNPYEEYFVPVNEHKKYMSGANTAVGCATYRSAAVTQFDYPTATFSPVYLQTENSRFIMSDGRGGYEIVEHDSGSHCII
ncbi:hypothetical protein EVAR_93595_1 [Eumeta japonica]|uniref:Uncharacterized protein n=1 Tax=Eumeta variegata TaxID=151549 RepID=A0A4C1TQF5_EUMVA|nr:hypothetical protein EVAR_93595_1 [Eumeta japonica]